MKVRIRNTVADRVLGDEAEDNKFLDEYAELGWTLAAAIILSDSGKDTIVRFYFTATIVEE